MIQINEVVYRQNISLKKANTKANYNQVDKRSVDMYKYMWNFDDSIANTLKLFTGELLPNIDNSKNKKRMFLNEMPEQDLNDVINFFEVNKSLVLGDILKGRGGFSAEWFLVTETDGNLPLRYVIKNINDVIKIYSQGNVKLSPKGSLKIGKVTMQRKGGTPDPTSLQFKINPLEIF